MTQLQDVLVSLRADVAKPEEAARMSARELIRATRHDYAASYEKFRSFLADRPHGSVGDSTDLGEGVVRVTVDAALLGELRAQPFVSRIDPNRTVKPSGLSSRSELNSRAG